MKTCALVQKNILCCSEGTNNEGVKKGSPSTPYIFGLSPTEDLLGKG